MAKISRNPWKDLLDPLLRLFPSKQVNLNFLKEGVYVFEPSLQVFLPYPKAARFPTGKLNLHFLRTVISLLEEPSLNVFKGDNKLTLRENSLSIDIPHTNKTDACVFTEGSKIVVSNSSDDLMDILTGLVGPLKRSKSAGIAENVYWADSTIYSYNGVVLSNYSGVPVLRKEQVAIPKNIVLFLSSFENDDIKTRLSLYDDNSVEIALQDEATKEVLVSVRFSQPDVPVPDWKSITPPVPLGWMPIPAMFFKLADIAIELANVYNSQIQLDWNKKTLKASSTPQYMVAFEFSEKTPFPNAKKGLLDTLYLKAVLEYSERVGWQDNYLVFAGNNYKFFVSLG